MQPARIDDKQIRQTAKKNTAEKERIVESLIERRSKVSRRDLRKKDITIFFLELCRTLQRLAIMPSQRQLTCRDKHGARSNQK